MHTLHQLLRTLTGKENFTIESLPSSGSNRKYFRLSDGSLSLIGVYSVNVEENRAFIFLSNHFHHQQLNVPKVLAVSDDEQFYLQEDLGDVSLFDLIKGKEISGETVAILHKTISLLADFQFIGAENLDFGVCYPLPEFNRRSIMWDLNYFKYNFLKTSSIEFREDLLEDDFERFADALLEEKSDTFMYRDFQSRNVMPVDNEPYFIDFQGGRKGPVYYDVASFLWQAKAHFSSSLRKELTETYIESLRKYQPVNEVVFHQKLQQFVLFRTLQVLGAYGFRGYFEKKTHFLQSIPFALDNLRELLQNGFDEYPYLKATLDKLVKPTLPTLTRFGTLLGLEGLEESKKPNLHPSLTVRIFSFAYKNGIPEDPSGNGGGYVFDCRSIHNPGRYDEYKNATGLDDSVIKFLEEDGEIVSFLRNIYPIVAQHVTVFKERNFTNLMISFGCTGGQHRSVYAAQKTAEYIAGNFDVNVELVHREQALCTKAGRSERLGCRNVGKVGIKK